MNIVQKVKNWWEYKDSNYIVAVNELKKAGLDNVLSFFFIGTFTIGFVFFKFYFFDIYDARKTLDILLNETLWVFTILVVLIFCSAHHYVREVSVLGAISKFLAKQSFNFFMGLVFIFIAGLSVRAFSIPFLKLREPVVFVASVEAIFFLCLSFWMTIILPKKTPNKPKLVKYLRFVAVVSLIIAIVFSFNS